MMKQGKITLFSVLLLISSWAQSARLMSGSELFIPGSGSGGTLLFNNTGTPQVSFSYDGTRDGTMVVNLYTAMNCGGTPTTITQSTEAEHDTFVFSRAYVIDGTGIYTLAQNHLTGGAPALNSFTLWFDANPTPVPVCTPEVPVTPTCYQVHCIIGNQCIGSGTSTIDVLCT